MKQHLRQPGRDVKSDVQYTLYMYNYNVVTVSNATQAQVQYTPSKAKADIAPQVQ